MDCFEDTTTAELKGLIREKLSLSDSEEISEFGRARCVLLSHHWRLVVRLNATNRIAIATPALILLVTPSHWRPRFRYFADGLKTVKEVGLKDFQKLDLKIASKRKAAPVASRFAIDSKAAVAVLVRKGFYPRNIASEMPQRLHAIELNISPIEFSPCDNSAATAPPASTAPVWEWFDNGALQWKAYSSSTDIERRMEAKADPKSRVIQIGARMYLLDFDNMTQSTLIPMPGGRFAKSNVTRSIRRRVGPPPTVPQLTPLLKEMVRRGEVPIHQALQMMGYNPPVR